MTRSFTGYLVALAFFGALLAAFLLWFIRPGLVEFGRPSLASSFDLQSYFMPRFLFGSDAILHGRVPLWNPFEYAGLPFLATTQPAVFYPPKILFYGLLPRDAAQWTFLVFHYVLAAVAMAYFLKKEGVREVGAFVGIVVWVFSIPILSSNYHPIRIANLCWMPPVFALSRPAAHGDRRAIALLALLVTVELSCGYPEFCTDQGVLIGVHALACWAHGVWKRPPQWTLPILGGAFVLGAVAAAAQLLPLAELAVVSNRERLVETGSFSFPRSIGQSPVLLTVPGLFGFAGVGLLLKRARPALWGLAACLVIGNGGWQLLRLVPGFSFIRFPLVWVYLSTFYFAWAAAVGADELASAEDDGKKRRLLLGVLAVTGVGFAAFYAAGFGAVGPGSKAAPTSLSLSIGTPLAAALGVAGGLVLTAAALLARTRRLAPGLWMAALCVAVLAHFAAFPFGAPTASFGVPEPMGQAARFSRFVHHLDGRTLSPDDILYGYEITDRQPSPLGAEQSFLPWRYRRIVSRLGFISMFGRIDWNAVSWARGYLDAMDVQLVTAPKELTPAFVEHGFAPITTADGVTYLANPTHMGHAWVNYAVRRAHTEGDALDYFVGRRFDPHREVLLEEPTRHDYPAPGRSTEGATAPLSEKRKPSGDVSFDVELPRPGVLVVSESAFPGWEATVDGRAAKCLRADYVLRGVELDRGRHQVSFEYRPWSFRWGAALSIAGFMAICALFIWRRNASNDTPVVAML